MSISGVGGGAQHVRSFQPPTFSSLDTDSSGGISLQELQAGAPGGASDTKSTARAQKLFDAMDTNKDGSISSSEKDAFDKKIQDQQSATQFMAQLFGSNSVPSNDDVFAATDKNGDGSVSLSEFSNSDAAKGISSDDLSKLFGKIDSDGNGSISSTESSDFLDSVKQAAGGPGGPGGPPPGPPPNGAANSSSDSDSDSTSSVLDLLKIASTAYSSTSSKSNDLLDTLSSIFDQAA